MATYPRPDFQRSPLNWSSLDGPWTFTFDDADSGKTEKWHKTSIANSSAKREINVPYAFQTSASGINLLEAHEVMWYERSITDIRNADDKAKGNRLIVRFGAVDYECEVWIDGSFVGGHRGGHVPFDVDVSDAFDEGRSEARLTLRVRDSPFDLTQPRGKQFWKPVPESIFYTPSGGIWLSVWLESVPAMRIAGGSGGTVLRSDDVDGGVLHAQVGVLGRRVGSESAAKVEVEASLGGIFVGKTESELPRDQNIANLDLSMKVDNANAWQRQEPFNVDGAWHDGVALWAPEHPILYDIILRLYNTTGNLVDEVSTTTGMRSLSWQTGDGTFRLNGKPYFQMLFLDQGYWPETGMTPPSSDALKTDIELAKKIGFNGCRKHQKVEDPRFYYWADRLGFVVWGEMANAYEFGGEYAERFTSEWSEAVKRDINHPSIVTWTPVNESWAVSALKSNIEQRNHVRALYYLTKNLDPSRPINDNCGWEHIKTDLTTFHDYSDSPELTTTCTTMTGILGPKAGHDMFAPPIYSGYSGSVILDEGARHTPGAPVICSEFGGVNITPPKDSKEAGERDWGYTTASDPDDFLVRFEKLVMGVVEGGHVCGLVWTQLCDIEQEVNGLYTYDRKDKVPAEKVKAIMDAAKDYYYGHVSSHHSKGLRKLLDQYKHVVLRK